MRVEFVDGETWRTWIGGKLYVGSYALCWRLIEAERAIRIEQYMDPAVRWGLEQEFRYVAPKAWQDRSTRGAVKRILRERSAEKAWEDQVRVFGTL